MDEKTLPAPVAQRFYDRIGSRYDWFEFYEARAKEHALGALQLSEGLRVLSVGVGTGKEQKKIISGMTPGGFAFGLDISPVMLRLTKERTSSPVCQADARQLPFASRSFDRLYAAYVLDLLPITDLADLVTNFHRVLKPSGIMVIIALTEGVDSASKALVAAWKGVFALSPALCGGCRPLELLELVHEAGFDQVEREVIVQLGVPSEIITAIKN
jgi:demethylmenaquinone methyltransferase/2-methoxy-6-polyprenyl-1,4-benzoquinol methylase